MTTAEQIGSKYGQSTDDFAKAASDTLTDIVMAWCNGGIDAMRTKIQKKVRTGGASTLAQSMSSKPIKSGGSKVSIEIVADKDAYYWKFVDKGVKGVKNKGKAPNSPYSFKNLGTSKAMIKSFKDYIARTGMKTAKIGGKRKSLYKTNKETKKKTAKMDLIEKAAQGMAVATKIGGIKPVNFVREATNKKRVDQLVNEVAKGLGATIKVSIKRVANEYNSK